MSNKLILPFEQQEKEKRRNLIFRTVYYDLLSIEHRAKLQTDLNIFANDNNKFGITEFHIESKVDGTPYVLARYWNDQDLTEKNLGWFDINIRMYGSFQFEEMDEIINKHDNKNLRLLGEKRFTYKTGEVVSILFWSTISKTARTQEALDALRAAFAR